MHLSFPGGKNIKRKLIKKILDHRQVFKANVHALISILTFFRVTLFLSPCNKDVKKTGLVSSRDLTLSKLCKTAQPLQSMSFIQILSRFYLDFIQILSRYLGTFVGYNPEEI